MAKRDYYRYELKNSRKTVYYGISNNPERRQSEHHGDGKKFSKMNTIGPRVTKKTAEEWENKIIKTYKRNHGGNPPKYNND